MGSNLYFVVNIRIVKLKELVITKMDSDSFRFGAVKIMNAKLMVFSFTKIVIIKEVVIY